MELGLPFQLFNLIFMVVFWRAKQMQRVDCFLNLVRKKKLAKHGKGLAGEEESLIINEDYQPMICEPRHTK